MTEEIRMIARSEFDESTGPTNSSPIQEIELEDEEEESISSSGDIEIIEAILIVEPIVVMEPATKQVGKKLKKTAKKAANKTA